MPITKEILSPFKKDIATFIETGTYYGDGIVAALECNFDAIFSIEAIKFRHYNCRRIFQENKNVILICGDSSKALKIVLKNYSVVLYFG